MSDDLFPDLEKLFDSLPEATSVPTWTARDGRVIKLSDMTIGHLSNTIRMVATNLEKARAEHDEKSAKRAEASLMELQSEYDSRDAEISQLTGILAALKRNATDEE